MLRTDHLPSAPAVFSMPRARPASSAYPNGSLRCKDSCKDRYKHAGTKAVSFTALVPLRDYPSESVSCKEPYSAETRSDRPMRQAWHAAWRRRPARKEGDL
ncbi:hypothetical protein BLA28_12075 [Eisenbergiella tayi]|nr:hypothetical protein BLA28_12075 [Eisenbergiella tayi]